MAQHATDLALHKSPYSSRLSWSSLNIRETLTAGSTPRPSRRFSKHPQTPDSRIPSLHDDTRSLLHGILLCARTSALSAHARYSYDRAPDGGDAPQAQTAAAATCAHRATVQLPRSKHDGRRWNTVQRSIFEARHSTFPAAGTSLRREYAIRDTQSVICNMQFPRAVPTPPLGPYPILVDQSLLAWKLRRDVLRPKGRTAVPSPVACRPVCGPWCEYAVRGMACGSGVCGLRGTDRLRTPIPIASALGYRPKTRRR